MTAERDMEHRLARRLEELADARVPPYFEAMIAETVRRPQRRIPWPTTPPRAFRLAVVPLALVVAALALLVWSIAVGSRPPPADLMDPLLSRPWQESPLVATAELNRAIDERCRPERVGLPASMPRVLTDVRGGFAAHAVYADEGGWMLCHVYVAADGKLDATQTLPAEEQPVMPLNSLHGVEEPPRYGVGGSSGSSRGYGEFAAGRVSPLVSRVDIVLRDGRRVAASVGEGWYVGWWPQAPPDAASSGGITATEATMDRVEGFNAEGDLVTGVNGFLLPEFAP